MVEQGFVVDRHSPPEAKIALFRLLFRGREDVYARRFENRKTGATGYTPACGNEWAPGVCEKPRIKCSACSHQRFQAVTDSVIRAHLTGRDDSGRDFAMGIYPMLLDERCFCLALKLDKPGWQDDARAILDTCRNMNLPAVLERSECGAHVWWFFDEAIPAVIARKLGMTILTATMERRPEIGLDTYDRFLPNQDTLPQATFGCVIAAPLQRKHRDAGNSLFLNGETLQAADDQ